MNFTGYRAGLLRGLRWYARLLSRLLTRRARFISGLGAGYAWLSTGLALGFGARDTRLGSRQALAILSRHVAFTFGLHITRCVRLRVLRVR